MMIFALGALTIGQSKMRLIHGSVMGKWLTATSRTPKNKTPALMTSEQAHDFRGDLFQNELQGIR